MKKLSFTLLFLAILLPLSVFSIFLPIDLKANVLPDIDVEITYVFDENNTDVDASVDGQTYGSTITPSPVSESESGYTFKYWVVNGVVRDDLPVNHTFYVTSSLNLIGVYSPDNANVVLFIDSNGNIIDTQFVADSTTVTAPTDLPSKPGLQIATTPWLEKTSNSSSLTINDDSVFVLQYERISTDTFNLNVVNDLEDTGTYDFNQLVTLTASANDGTNDFSHWEEDGIVLSRDLEYSFTMLSDRNLEKVYLSEAEANEALVTLSTDLSLRDNYHSYMGQFYLPENTELIEYGFLIHDDNTLNLTLGAVGVTIAKSNSYNTQTNEYLTSFPIGSHKNVRAYAVIYDGSLTTLYSDNQINLELIGFEDADKSSPTLNTTPLEIDGIEWFLDNAIIGTTEDDKKVESKSVRFERGTAVITTAESVEDLYKITFDVAKYASDSDSTLIVEVSADNQTYFNIIDALTGDEFISYRISSTTLETIDLVLTDSDVFNSESEINDAVSLYIRITKIAGNRVNMDRIVFHSLSAAE